MIFRFFSRIARGLAFSVMVLLPMDDANYDWET